MAFFAVGSMFQSRTLDCKLMRGEGSKLTLPLHFTKDRSNTLSAFSPEAMHSLKSCLQKVVVRLHGQSRKATHIQLWRDVRCVSVVGGHNPTAEPVRRDIPSFPRATAWDLYGNADVVHLQSSVVRM